MDLFFFPFACSFAGRVAVYEAGLERDVALRQVDLETQRVDNGAD